MFEAGVTIKAETVFKARFVRDERVQIFLPRTDEQIMTMRQVNGFRRPRYTVTVMDVETNCWRVLTLWGNQPLEVLQ